MRRWVRVAQVAATVAAVLGVQGTTTAAQAVPIPGGTEATYSAPGPWEVVHEGAAGCCDGAGAAFDLWYPAALGAGGTRHPIVLWGNGTGATPDRYTALLRHFASWGFVVVATRNPYTGSGIEIRQSLDHVLARAADPADEFHGRVQTGAVGAVGHSQGATGVVNALRDAGGAIRTAVPLEIPTQALCSNKPTCADTRTLSQGSVFFVNGSADTHFSPSHQTVPWPLAGLQSNRAYFEATPPWVPRVWATLEGADHNDVQGQPGCAEASAPCAAGVQGYLGFPTAWLVARLFGDHAAARAFTVGGELFTAPGWRNQIGTVW